VFNFNPDPIKIEKNLDAANFASGRHFAAWLGLTP
jgi:transposase